MIVGVIGAGLSGLLVASELQRRGVETVVFEAADRVGGVARTVRDRGFLLEPAGGSFMLPHPALDHFISNFSLDVTPARSAGRRYVWAAHGLVELPSNPLGLVAAPIVSTGAKVRAVAEIGVTSTSPDGETLLGFMQRRFGDEAGGVAAQLAGAGVFGGDPSRLGVEASFPRLVEMERTSGSILRAAVDGRRRVAGAQRPRLHVPIDGMGALLEGLAADLGDRVMLGSAVESIEQTGGRWRIAGSEHVDVDRVVAAVDPEALSRIAPDALRAVLRGRPAAPVAVVGLGGPSERLDLPSGFGALYLPEPGRVGLGALFESSYAPGRAPEGSSLVKVIVGGARNPHIMEWSDDYLVRVVGGELTQMLGASIDVEWTHVTRHSRGIPQYNVGHLRWIERLEAVLRSVPGLSVTGWGYRGVGIGHVAADALRVADELAPA